MNAGTLRTKARTALVGQRFGLLLVLECAGLAGYHLQWRCLCDCGRETVCYGTHLRRGNTRSCGCGLIKHLMTDSPEYRTWTHMRQRCNNPENEAYGLYGGRGIRICSEWNVFERFYQDMGPRPSLAHSLDRFPDPNGNYELANCRWATPMQQAANLRTARIIEFRNQRYCIAEWSRRSGLGWSTIANRLARGLTPEDALTLPGMKGPSLLAA